MRACKATVYKGSAGDNCMSARHGGADRTTSKSGSSDCSCCMDPEKQSWWNMPCMISHRSNEHPPPSPVLLTLLVVSCLSKAVHPIRLSTAVWFSPCSCPGRLFLLLTVPVMQCLAVIQLMPVVGSEASAEPVHVQPPPA